MAGHWSQVKVPKPGARTYHSLTYDAHRERIVLFGGSEDFSKERNDTWEWDGKAWSQVATFGPGPRRRHAAAYDSNLKRVMIFGGDRAIPNNNFEQEVLSDPWEWGGSGWTKLPDFGPPARLAAAMAYDSKRQRMMLFGGGGRHQKGSSSGPITGISDYDPRTWEWDGRGWAVCATGGPSGRYGHSMVYDAARERVVLFGGAVDDVPPKKGEKVHTARYFGDTWEWNGTAWTQRSDIGPAPRALHAMAYDSDRGRTVLFAGQISNDPDEDVKAGIPADTWEWDGSAWMQVADMGPGHWVGADMAYDRARQQMVLFGGAGIGANKSVWIWHPAAKPVSNDP